MTNHSTLTGDRQPWTPPRLESLDVAATLAGNQAGKESAALADQMKTLLS